MKEKRLSLIIKANNSRYEIKEEIQKRAIEIAETPGSCRKCLAAGDDEPDAPEGDEGSQYQIQKR